MQCCMSCLKIELAVTRAGAHGGCGHSVSCQQAPINRLGPDVMIVDQDTSYI
jgi:hypothetical protein